MNSSAFPTKQTQQPATIVQLIPALQGGGAETCVVQTAKAVQQAGWRSLVVSAGGGLVPELTQSGVRHELLPAGEKTPRTLFLIPRLRQLLLSEQVRLVDVHSRVPAWLLQLTLATLSAANRPQVVTTVHGLNRPGIWSRVMVRGDRVIAVSEAAQRHLCAAYPDADRGRIRVIPRGVDTRLFPANYVASDAWMRSFFAEFPQAVDRRLLLFPARMSRARGQKDFLQLMAELIQEGRNVFGLMVGDCSRHLAYVAGLREFADQLGIGKCVAIAPQRADLRELYAAADVVLSLPTKPESFGLVVAEALSMGRPVVAWDQGGAGDLLQKCWAAGAVPAGDRQALMSVIRGILEGQIQAPQASCPYPLQQTLEQTLAVYRELLEPLQSAP